jgi:hypothetical protein
MHNYRRGGKRIIKIQSYSLTYLCSNVGAEVDIMDKRKNIVVATGGIPGVFTKEKGCANDGPYR